MTMRDISELLDGAAHSSVTEQRLTEIKPSLTTRYLHDKPLIDYLRDGEQPHFILAARNKTVSVRGANPPSKPERSGTGMVMHMLTDQRWLTVAANQHGDQSMSVPLSDITGVESSKGGHGAHELSFSTEDFMVKVPIANLYDNTDIESAHQWLLQHTNAGDNDSSGVETAQNVETESRVPTEKFTNLADPDKHLDAEPQGSWVTAERVKKMGDTLDEDENVHYMFKGGDTRRRRFLFGRLDMGE